MFGELTGGLIQMNAHMVVTEAAWRTIICGSIIVVLFGVMLVVFATDQTSDRWKIRRIGACVLMVALGMALTIIGANMPRVKEIRACADGQVSLEQVAGRYDIINVDGKELTLRVR